MHVLLFTEKENSVSACALCWCIQRRVLNFFTNRLIKFHMLNLTCRMSIYLAVARKTVVYCLCLKSSEPKYMKKIDQKLPWHDHTVFFASSLSELCYISSDAIHELLVVAQTRKCKLNSESISTKQCG
jgi:hypothetical protein